MTDTTATDPTLPADGGPPARAVEQLVIAIELGRIKPSPTNPRKIFDEVGLRDLAESIKSKGVLSPILVRPARKGDGFELVFGERRWRAAKLAKVATVPAMVREMSDQDVLEAQVIENLQRVDVHPLEEADGYRALMDQHGYSAEVLAKKVGKSKAYVYARLKLCELAAAPREACIDGRLSASVALLIARLPTAELQQRATREVLGEEEPGPVVEQRGDTWTGNDVQLQVLNVRDDKGRVRVEPQPLTARAAQVHLRQNYMLRLAGAPFITSDAEILPSAGACTTCPKRTGNARDLFDDVDNADVCTDPGCYQAKSRAAWDQMADAARARGMKVLEGREASGVWSWDGKTVAHGSAYVDPKGEVPWEIVQQLEVEPKKRPTWRALLGKAAQPVAVAQDSTGELRRLLSRKDAIAKLQELGKLKPTEEPEAQSKEQKKAKAEAAAREAEVRREAATALLEQVSSAGRTWSESMAEGTLSTADEHAVWKVLALTTLRQLVNDFEGVDLMAGRHRINRIKTGLSDGLQRLAKKAGTVPELVALTVESIAANSLEGWVDGLGYQRDEVVDLCKALGVDVKALEKAARARLKEREAAAPPNKATPAKKGKRRE